MIRVVKHISIVMVTGITLESEQKLRGNVYLQVPTICTLLHRLYVVPQSVPQLHMFKHTPAGQPVNMIHGTSTLFFLHFILFLFLYLFSHINLHHIGSVQSIHFKFIITF